MNFYARRLVIFMALLLTALTLLVPPRVQAHAGGALQLSNARVGPYETSVWTLPDPLRAAEEAHVTLMLLEPAEPGQTQQQFVTDATVTIVAQPAGASEPRLEATAVFGADPLYPLFYEGTFELPEGGEWRFEVRVETSEGPVSQSFTSIVLAPPGPDIPWAILAALVVAAAALAYLIARRRRADSPDPQGASHG